MHDVPRTHSLGFDRNRGRNHTLRSVPRAQKAYVIYAVEQWDDSSYIARVLERAECGLQLRGLDAEPKHVDGRNLRTHENIRGEAAKRTLQAKLPGILRQGFAPHHQGDRSTRVR